MNTPLFEHDNTTHPPASCERRLGSRVHVSLHVRCQVQFGETFFARATDISLGGVFIESDERPRFGAEIAITTVLPGTSFELNLPGYVRWNKPHGFGVQFGLLGAKETHFLTGFLRG